MKTAVGSWSHVRRPTVTHSEPGTAYLLFNRYARSPHAPNNPETKSKYEDGSGAAVAAVTVPEVRAQIAEFASSYIVKKPGGCGSSVLVRRGFIIINLDRSGPRRHGYPLPRTVSGNLTRKSLNLASLRKPLPLLASIRCCPVCPPVLVWRRFRSSLA
jgi:hypothetical protein